MTHRELSIIAAKYLRSNGIARFTKCKYSVVEFACSSGESPDAFGFSGYSTQLIEVKMSAADFMADKKKQFRIDPTKGIGNYRSYLCPEGVIKESELPQHWGLLYFMPDGEIQIVKQPESQDSNTKSEMMILLSIMRREGIKPKMFDYFKTNNIYKKQLT